MHQEIQKLINKYSSLPYHRSTASSKASSPQTAHSASIRTPAPVPRPPTPVPRPGDPNGGSVHIRIVLSPEKATSHLFLSLFKKIQILHHHHQHQGLDPLILSVSRVTTALANVSSVFQLFSFLVVCSGMISKGIGFVAFFASVKASSICFHLSCLVCM